MAVHNTQGRYLPQRVLVLSAKMPTVGSINASMTRANNKIVPAAVAFIPNTSV